MEYKEVLEKRKKLLGEEIKQLREDIKHSDSKGNAVEQKLKGFLEKHLPKKYRLGKGFVVNNAEVSAEHDLIVYDEIINVSILSEEGSSHFAGGSVYGVIETTVQELNIEKLETDIEKLGKLRKMFPGEKVGFKKFERIPVINKKSVSDSLENGIFLESGIPFDDVWKEGVDKGYWEESGHILEKLRKEDIALSDMTHEQLKELKDFIIENEAMSPYSVVGEREIYSSPPPRAYICALSGTTYKNEKTLKENIEKLTIKHGVHLHGLFILGATNTEDWFFANKAFENNKVYFEKGQVIHRFLAEMIKAFNVMLVGKYPAIM